MVFRFKIYKVSKMIHKLLSKLRAFFEYKLYLYCHMLPTRLYNRYEFPSKFLVKYYVEIDPSIYWDNKISQIAHMYAYDSTVTKSDLSLIFNCYNINTRERVRQILSKYIRQCRYKLKK